MSSPSDIFATPEQVEHWVTATLSRLDASEEILDCPPVEEGPCADCERTLKVRRHLGRMDLCRECLLRRLAVRKTLEQQQADFKAEFPRSDPNVVSEAKGTDDIPF